MPANAYLDSRNGAYYVAGTRIGLDVIAHEFRNGRSPEAMLDAYPSIGSLAKVYGVITFMLENSDAIDAYLEEQEARFRDIVESNPLPPELLTPFQQGKKVLASRRK